ncbi:MarR family winged helix-turn-helix transcriptional regulator [Cytophagaceae bacterium YF14B1]|uniref:MarR family winged helix-turn-helix transcriptional regulator n=1 Tax=Xanthocytophaga flava TaxID=3048013 RepID=A0AAE3U8R0_9BACT|nr:MarR family winged helix-turn-helix transcriptional regulator [Xanthocytophaga flavus]MDJ1480949.1 MarR family winged helix-turn-helix transcriptional regulator [Xanthocytophaga flavus]
MNRPSAVPMLIEWERFTEENPQGDIREFASWLLTHTDPLRKDPFRKDLPARASQLLQDEPVAQAEPLMKSGMRLSEAFQENGDFLAWFFMGRLIRYVKFYTKAMMAQHGMSGPDEFLFLSLINEMDRPTKKEVCIAHASELTTGMDILRRLRTLGLIEEHADERDARSKRLTLTDKGHKTIGEVSMGLAQLQHSVLADLDPANRKHLIETLQYLNNYHFPFFKL